jgi:hypothetical protein
MARRVLEGLKRHEIPDTWTWKEWTITRTLGHRPDWNLWIATNGDRCLISHAALPFFLVADLAASEDCRDENQS